MEKNLPKLIGNDGTLTMMSQFGDLSLSVSSSGMSQAMVIYGHLWSVMVINGHVWSFMDKHLPKLIGNDGTLTMMSQFGDLSLSVSSLSSAMSLSSTKSSTAESWASLIDSGIH